MRSLRSRLLSLWALSLLSSLVLGLLLVTLHRQSASAQAGRAQAVLARGCDLIRDRYGFYVSGWTGPAAPDAAMRRDLVSVVSTALAHQGGVEGGIWASEGGALADASPTGSPVIAPASAQVAAINADAAREERTVGRVLTDATGAVLLAACPLDGPIDGLTAWTAARVEGGSGFGPLGAGLLTLLGLLALSAILLGRTLLVWNRHVQRIEGALTGSAGEALPPLGRSGERELDRIVDALNQAGARLAEARTQSDALARRVAQAERLAALGRVAAGVAHEIRNPIAAARLQGENALAGGPTRLREGVADMLEQLGRLDGLVSELLAMTQRTAPAPVSTELDPFLRAVAAHHAAAGAERGVVLRVAAGVAAARLDPAMVERILHNLLSNAVRHAAPGGTVTLAAESTPGTLVLSVADDGPGVPVGMAERVFEPFVTGRADGTGLGLAIARELADAHGGRLTLRACGGPGSPTVFALELPELGPVSEAACPPS